MQELEEKHSNEALDIAHANLTAAHDHVSQLHSQLQQAQAKAAGVTHAEAQISQLQARLQQETFVSGKQATAVAELTNSLEEERTRWQQERQSLLGRAKVNCFQIWRLAVLVDLA